MLGFGNVARSFSRYLLSLAASGSSNLLIAAAADSSGGTILPDPAAFAELFERKQRGEPVASCNLGTVYPRIEQYLRALPGSGVTTLIESLPTDIRSGEPACSLVLTAIDAGLHVVTVDKGPLVHRFDALMEAAARRGVRIGYTGTTGLRPPNGLSRCTVSEIRGVLNGTTNYILTEMRERSRPFDDALREAQVRGIAEPDPSLDLAGWDTACKLFILAKAWMGAAVGIDEVARAGIGPGVEPLIRNARDTGSRVRLVGTARLGRGRPRLGVSVEIVGPRSPFFDVEGTSKAAVFRTRERGDLVVPGLSGRDSISRTILRDVLEVLAQD